MCGCGCVLRVLHVLRVLRVLFGGSLEVQRLYQLASSVLQIFHRGAWTAFNLAPVRLGLAVPETASACVLLPATTGRAHAQPAHAHGHSLAHGDVRLDDDDARWDTGRQDLVTQSVQQVVRGDFFVDLVA